MQLTGLPCHADWLLEVANSPEPIEAFLDTTTKEQAFALQTEAVVL